MGSSWPFLRRHPSRKLVHIETASIQRRHVCEKTPVRSASNLSMMECVNGHPYEARLKHFPLSCLRILQRLAPSL